MKLIRNVRTLFRHPALTQEYLSYSFSKLMNSGNPIRHLPGGIKITQLSGFSEYHSCADFVSQEELDFMSKLSFESGAVIDIGANLGVVSCILANRFPDRTIHAFEPVPSTFQALKTNIKLNSCRNIRALKYALAAHDGDIHFRAMPKGSATNSITESSADNAISVPCITLDSYMRDSSIENIAFLKVDVEGYETLVFQGAERVLTQRQAAIIYYEVCPEITAKAGFDPSLPSQMLIRRGYEIFKLDRLGALNPVQLSDIRETVYDNWIALRSS